MVEGHRGRPRLDIPLEVIVQTLRQERYVARAAQIIGCSRGYIYNRLKAAGLSLQQVLESNEKTPDSKL